MENNKYIEPITAEKRGHWPSKWVVLAKNPDNKDEVLEFDSIDALNKKLFELRNRVNTLTAMNNSLISAGDALAEHLKSSGSSVKITDSEKTAIDNWNSAKSNNVNE